MVVFYARIRLLRRIIINFAQKSSLTAIMIEQIIIQNFLSFKNKETFDFIASMEKPKKGFEYMKWYEEMNRKKILKAQFLFGNNATGKSNFLSVISAVKDIICTKRTSKSSVESKLPITYFKLSSTTIGKPTFIKITFHTKGIRYQYSVEYDDETIYQETLIKNINPKKEATIFDRHYDKEKDISELKIPNDIFSKETQTVLRENVIKNTSVISIYDDKNIESADFKNVYAYFNNAVVIYHIGSLHLPYMLAGRKDGEALEKIIVPLLQDLGSNITGYHVDYNYFPLSDLEINILKNSLGEKLFNEQYPNGKRKEPSVRFSHNTDRPNEEAWLSENEESYGTLNMLRLIILLYDACKCQSPIAIDECAIGIHQQTFGRIIQFFLSISSNLQFFMASQQVTIMEMDGFRRDTVKFFDKDRTTGITTCKKIDMKKYHKNINIVNAYLNDSFGCLPEYPTQEQWEEKLLAYKEQMQQMIK